MSGIPNKRSYFILEGVNAFATSYFINYLFFYLRDQFGFGNAGNLLVTALHGLTYVLSAWFAGRFAQRRGYFLALRLGWGIIIAALATGGLLAENLTVQFVVVIVWTLGLSFTWPTLEALASDGESPSSLSHVVGIYNMVWAGGAALAYFSGGAITELLGWRAIYWLPILCHIGQLILLYRLGAYRTGQVHAGPVTGPIASVPLNPRPIAKARTFLRLAWVANPLAYIAINVVLPVMPKVAADLALTPAKAGMICSVWLFARMAAFAWLRRWPGWHYRFRWLFGAYICMVVGFAALLLIPKLEVLIGAQIIFGFAVGLIYYSSLYYSMDAGDAKGDHGGVHEAVIGAGVFIGPTLGLIALHLAPHLPNAGILAVSTILAGATVILPIIRRGFKRRQT